MDSANKESTVKSYKFIFIDASLKDEEKQLNELAAQGWRLVTAIPHGNGTIFYLESDKTPKKTGKGARS